MLCGISSLACATSSTPVLQVAPWQGAHILSITHTHTHTHTHTPKFFLSLHTHTTPGRQTPTYPVKSTVETVRDPSSDLGG
ncbi:uncharacterized protein BDR25DRAFT_391714 [Lindgomyces ingoldianus]|uniref:Uncharacterized protein n=1 Tax=Lindgomyces ingoldianus TaxID=673940 RepID=A0ACB6R840_9PLEO|nr:uncharacterized protein BDR25DRAFT_391714 [Lindgomyces ingoldianus]KAF2474621.1 hypothetical protein BDR25DRAFT_391714 [Lindgomyces ingoldianus]